MKYLVRRHNPERHDKRCKVVYEVTVDGGGDQFLCECGNFEHTRNVVQSFTEGT